MIVHLRIISGICGWTYRFDGGLGGKTVFLSPVTIIQ